MFLTLFLILSLGVILGYFFNKIKLPALIAYLLIGIALSYFNLMDEGIANISSELRKIALIIILLKAGLTVNLSDLKKIGRPAILLCFLPAAIELVAIGFLAPLFFDISYLHSFLMGAVLAAVSPAVVVPRMVKMIEEGHGVERGIPQMIITGASFDDIFVILIYTSLLGLSAGSNLDFMTVLNVPISIVLGIGAGIVIGILLSILFKKIHIRDSLKIIFIFAVCFGFVALEEGISGFIGFSSLLASLTLGMTILFKNKIVAGRLSLKYSKLWVVAEMFLFVLVGSAIQIEYFLNFIIPALIIIVFGLAFRFIGVFIATTKTKLSLKEKLFTMISYSPKATVQAAIGGGLLDLGNSMPDSALKVATISAGIIVLSVSVVAILFTAPLGAIGIDISQSILIENNNVDLSKE